MGINRASGLKRLGILAAARLAFVAFATLALFGAAEAQYITYVATNGNDTNPCTVITAPCKTLQRAVNVTSAYGTVRVLTPLISSVFINKSINITGDGVPIVGQITIGGATAIVTLRGLALDGVEGYVNGIRIDAAAAVHIENCSVERYSDYGIKLFASTATELFVSNTVSRNNAIGLAIDDSAATAMIENSRFENNTSAGLYLKLVKAHVVRSTASGNYDGVYVHGGTVNITETTAADNGHHGFTVISGGVTLTSSEARGNDTGLWIQAGMSVTMTNSVITSNLIAIANGGALYTRQNNTVGGTLHGPAAIPIAAY